METKKCLECKQTKPLLDFVSLRGEGYRQLCEACSLKARLYQRTPKRKASLKARNKGLYQRRKEYSLAYSQRPRVKKRLAELARGYRRDPILRGRHEARWFAKHAVRAGRIEQQPCAGCGKADSEMHHPNYDEPLRIVWLCVECHKELHRRIKANAE